MEEKLKQIDELIIIAVRRFHKKKATFFAEVRSILEKHGEKTALEYIKQTQTTFGSRGDVTGYEMMEAITAIKKVFK